MSLKVELKPHEKLIVGTCVITNSDQRARLFIDGKAPVLREKDILTASTADTPAKAIYFVVQLIYLEGTVERLTKQYFGLVNDIVQAAPSMTLLVDEINTEILSGQLYRALRAAKRLIQHEQNILASAAAGSTGLSHGR